MIVIMSQWQQVIRDKCLSKRLHCLELLNISNILDGDRIGPAGTLPPAAFLPKRMPKFAGGIDRLLLQTANSRPPIVF